jgi:phospholipid/cholesterol/gamma-HCH transport system ATP-binding protein
MENQPLLEFKGVTKRFGDRTNLDSIDLKIYEGEVTTIIGLSGAGESVLLKHIIGLLKPDDGQILYRGQPIDHMSKPSLPRWPTNIRQRSQEACRNGRH